MIFWKSPYILKYFIYSSVFLKLASKLSFYPHWEITVFIIIIFCKNQFFFYVLILFIYKKNTQSIHEFLFGI